MIFAFMSEKFPLENEKTPINFITVQNVIEAFDENIGFLINKIIINDFNYNHK